MRIMFLLVLAMVLFLLLFERFFAALAVKGLERLRAGDALPGHGGQRIAMVHIPESEKMKKA